jgi:hypothetical protein
MSLFTNRNPTNRVSSPSPGLIDDPPLPGLKDWWYNVKRFQTQQFFTIEGTTDQLGVQIRDETFARKEGDEILAGEIESIIVSVGGASKISVQSFPPTPPNRINDLWVDTSDLNKTKYWDGTAWIYRIDGDAFAAISTESTARISGDQSLATQINTVIANYQAADAVIQSSVSVETTARSNADSALASQITTVDSQYKAADVTLQANITSEASTRASADTALANAISTIQAGVGNKITVGNTAPTTPAPLVNDLWLDTGNQNQYKFWNGSSWVYQQDLVLNASITTEANARAQADGFLSGKYTLTVAAGNVVTGMNITSQTGGGTNISDVTFVAANFKIYNGFTGVTMFNISGSTVMLANTLVVSTANKVYIGAGNYNSADTALYIDGNGYFSLKNSLVYNPAASDLTVTGTIRADSGFFGNSSSDVSISAGGLIIGNTGTIITSGVAGIMSGVGIFLGFDAGSYKFRVGDPGGAYILWDGNSWTQVGFVSGGGVLGKVDGGGSFVGGSYGNLSPNFSISIACDGAIRVISFTSGSIRNTSGGTATVFTRIVRDGTVTVGEMGGVNAGIGLTMGGGVAQPIQYTGNDTPPAGLHTYTVQAYSSVGGGVVVTGTLLVA